MLWHDGLSGLMSSPEIPKGNNVPAQLLKKKPSKTAVTIGIGLLSAIALGGATKTAYGQQMISRGQALGRNVAASFAARRHRRRTARAWLTKRVRASAFR